MKIKKRTKKKWNNKNNMKLLIRTVIAMYGHAWSVNVTWWITIQLKLLRLCWQCHWSKNFQHWKKEKLNETRGAESAARRTFLFSYCIYFLIDEKLVTVDQTCGPGWIVLELWLNRWLVRSSVRCESDSRFVIAMWFGRGIICRAALLVHKV